MDLNSVLKYQKVDAKLFELENELAGDPNKSRCNELNQIAKNSQTKSNQLEEQAGQILREISELNKTIVSTQKKGEQLLREDVSNLSKEKLEEQISLKDKVCQNLSVLDKRLTKLAENINSVLAEFNSTIKSYNHAKEEYQKFKLLFDQKALELEPKIKQVKAELAGLEKSVDPKLFQTYSKKRADKIFPVFVGLVGNTCGRCRMELSASAISKLKEDKILTCEHCRRVIYLDN